MEGADPGPAPLTDPVPERPDWAQIEPPDWDDEPEPDEPPAVAESLVAESPLAESPVVEPLEAIEPEPTAPDAVELSTQAGRGLLLPVALGLVLLVLLGAVGWLVLDARDGRARDDARQAALQVARQQAVNLTTISYQTADADLGRIIGSATGTLKTQFEAQRAQFPAVLARDKSVSVGTVLAAGVASQSAGTVEALVAVDAAVSTAETTKAAGRPLVKHYRMDMKLVLVGDRWLVSQVAFAGLPQ